MGLRKALKLPVVAFVATAFIRLYPFWQYSSISSFGVHYIDGAKDGLGERLFAAVEFS